MEGKAPQGLFHQFLPNYWFWICIHTVTTPGTYLLTWGLTPISCIHFVDPEVIWGADHRYDGLLWGKWIWEHKARWGQVRLGYDVFFYFICARNECRVGISTSYNLRINKIYAWNRGWTSSKYLLLPYSVTSIWNEYHLFENVNETWMTIILLGTLLNPIHSVVVVQTFSTFTTYTYIQGVSKLIAISIINIVGKINWSGNLVYLPVYLPLSPTHACMCSGMPPVTLLIASRGLFF